jgi:DNA-binding NtrC family response regulator
MKKSTAARVLVVDDEALVRWSLAETLQARGYDVLEAGDGAAAIEALSAESGRIDVVLLDLRLPDCDDLHVLSEVRQIAPAASIILMTAFGTPDVLDDALRIGAYVVLHKPFDMDGVGPLIERALAARSS